MSDSFERASCRLSGLKPVKGHCVSGQISCCKIYACKYTRVRSLKLAQLLLLMLDLLMDCLKNSLLDSDALKYCQDYLMFQISKDLVRATDKTVSF